MKEEKETVALCEEEEKGHGRCLSLSMTDSKSTLWERMSNV